MFEFFEWINNIYLGITNLPLKILMLMGFIAVGNGLGFLLLFIVYKITGLISRPF